MRGFLASARADPRSDVARRNLLLVLNYGLILLTGLVWFASAVARLQIDHNRIDHDGRVVIACAAAVPLVVSLAALFSLRRSLGSSFGLLVRDLVRATWRIGAAVACLVVALVAIAGAAFVSPHTGTTLLLLATAAAFAAVVAIPRRLPPQGGSRPAR